MKRLCTFNIWPLHTDGFFEPSKFQCVMVSLCGTQPFALEIVVEWHCYRLIHAHMVFKTILMTVATICLKAFFADVGVQPATLCDDVEYNGMLDISIWGNTPR